MIRQTERTTPHRQYIASYEDAITRKSAIHNPFVEPMIFSGIGSELLGGVHYLQDTVDKFDKISYHRGMPLPDLRFHPSTLAVGENHLKNIYVERDNYLESSDRKRELFRPQRNLPEEEVEDVDDNAVLNRLFSGGKRKKKSRR
jgi:hypothetical protein